MWFRPRSQQNDNDRFRMSSIRNKIRQRKSVPNAPNVPNEDAVDGRNVNSSTSKKSTSTITVVTAPSRIRDEALGSVIRSQSGRRLSLLNTDDDDENEPKEKEKVLRTDQKYKNNRITKSSSRTKVPDIKIATDKHSTIKNIPANNGNNSGQRKISAENSTKTTPVKVKTTRRNTNLNLNALLRYKSFISGSTKKLTHDDFDRLRRKSLGETNKVRRRSSTDTEQQCEKSVAQSTKGKNNTSNNNRSNKNTLTVPGNERQSFDSDKSNEDDFHSCSEDVDDDQHRHYESRKSSPSLKSRVAAKWSESVQKATSKKAQKCENHQKKGYFY